MEKWDMDAASYGDSGFAGDVNISIGPIDLPENVGSAAPGIGGSSSGSSSGSGDTGGSSGGSGQSSSNSGSSGGPADSSGSSSGSDSHSSSGGSSTGSGSVFIELTDEDEKEIVTTGRTPESEIVQITIFDNFVDPVQTASVTAAALPKGETAGNPGLLAVPAALLAAALAIGFLLRSRGRRHST